ncbi:MAG: hypothetical protein WCX82_01900 [archaeon]|jgi:uncharacterized membrane protein (DUF2068 family)
MVAKKKVVKKIKTLPKAKPKIVKKEEPKKERPLGIKIISTYYIIVSVLSFIVGILVTLFPEKISEYTINSIQATQSSYSAAMFTPTVILIMGSIMVVVGIIGFVLGLGLWNMKKWARMLLIVFAVFGFFMALMGLTTGEFSNIVGLLINGFIAGYLIFCKDVKAVFK